MTQPVRISTVFPRNLGFLGSVLLAAVLLLGPMAPYSAAQLRGGRTSSTEDWSRDALHGKEADDEIEGTEGNDEVAGEGGQDILRGGAGRDTLNGGDGDDVMDGGDGDDRLQGGEGDDVMRGGPGDDKLHGGEGEDILIGGPGKNGLWGGNDADVFVLEPTEDPEQFDEIFDFSLSEKDQINLSAYFPDWKTRPDEQTLRARIRVQDKMLQVDPKGDGNFINAAKIGKVKDLDLLYTGNAILLGKTMR